MKRYQLTLVMILMLTGIMPSGIAHAGEITIKVPEEPLRRITWMICFMHGLIKFSGSPANPDKELFTKTANFILPALTSGRVSKLPGEVLVMKDAVIVQIPDAKLREMMDDSYRNIHLPPELSEKQKIVMVGDYVVFTISRGIYKALTEVPAEVSVRFDDPKYERE